MYNHPETVILDPLENVRKLMDRYKQYKLIDDSELAREGMLPFFSINNILTIVFKISILHSDGVFTPTFVELTTTDVNENLRKLEEANVSFPFG